VSDAARVLSVNVGAARDVEWRGDVVRTGIWKDPVGGRVALRGVNFAGDDQADRRVHGGRDKAVYSYAREDYDWWRGKGIDARPGLFGENLTVEGHDLTSAVVGERWRVGSVELEVAQPRLPCFKLGMRLGDSSFVKKFLAARRPGAYLRVIREGDVGAGDAIEVSFTPKHGITLGDMVDALHDVGKAEALRAIPDLPEFWKKVAERR
jgi:MOSC domain-containing protein YiiM